jgi:hypothetical protein
LEEAFEHSTSEEETDEYNCKKCEYKHGPRSSPAMAKMVPIVKIS